MFVISGSKYDKPELKLEGMMNRSNEIVMTPPPQRSTYRTPLLALVPQTLRDLLVTGGHMRQP